MSVVVVVLSLTSCAPRYDELAANKDIQMLAMLSIIILQTPLGHKKRATARPSLKIPIAALPLLKTNVLDFFALTHAINQVASPSSPAYHSPVAPPIAASVASSTSSRGSWSSIPGLGRFVAGLQDGLTTPNEAPATTSYFPEPISKQNSIEKISLHPIANIQKKRNRKDSSLYSPVSTGSKSWNEGQPPTPRSLSVSFSSAGHRRSGLLRVKEISPLVQEKRRVLFEPAIIEERCALS